MSANEYCFQSETATLGAPDILFREFAVSPTVMACLCDPAPAEAVENELSQDLELNGRREFTSLSLMSGPVIRDAGMKGRGVFSARAYEAGDVIEEAPVHLIDRAFESPLGRIGLSTHLWRWNESHVAMAGGCGAFYNHSSSPNAIYERDFEALVFRFKACGRIEPGEEITIDYRPDTGGSLWFKVIEDRRGEVLDTTTDSLSDSKGSLPWFGSRIAAAFKSFRSRLAS